MVGAQYRAERMRPLDAAVDALLVEIVAEEINAVRAGEVVERISVEVSRRDPARRFEKRADRQVPAYVAAELKRDAIRFGELQVRDELGGLGCKQQCAGVSSAIEIREPRKVGAPPRGNLARRCIGAEEPRLVVLVERHQRGHESGDARVPRERPVLRLRQIQPRLQAGRRRRQTHGDPA